MQTDRLPKVFAHRGASEESAEHTLGAYIKALDQGAEGLECDVRLTADGHLVCVHDRNLRRTGNQPGVVSTLRLSELSEVDFAAWKSPWADLDDEAPDRDESLDTVLTLRKLLEVVADYDRFIEVAVETKHPTRFGGLVEKRLAGLLKEFGWRSHDTPVKVMSFSWTAMHRMRRLVPDLRVVQLVENPARWPMLRRTIGPDWLVGPGIDSLRENPWLGKSIRRSGHEINVWTVNTREELELCVDLGVTAVMTDKPKAILDLRDQLAGRDSAAPER